MNQIKTDVYGEILALYFTSKLFMVATNLTQNKIATLVISLQKVRFAQIIVEKVPNDTLFMQAIKLVKCV